MELAFRTRLLRTICEDPDKAAETYHPEVVETLIRRLGDLRAVTSPLEIFTGKPRFTNGPARMHLQLALRFEIILKPNHSIPRLDNIGDVDWVRVRRIQIMSVEGRLDEE